MADGAVTRALTTGKLGTREAALLALIVTPKAMEDCAMRACSPSNARRWVERGVTVVEQGIQV